MVVAYIADAFKTGDAMEAYCLSADLVVKRSDLEKLEGILTHCLAEKKRNYAAFFDAMAEGGREL